MVMYVWRGGLSALSIALYALVVYFFRNQLQSISDTQQHMAQKNADRQRQVRRKETSIPHLNHFTFADDYQCWYQLSIPSVADHHTQLHHVDMEAVRK